MSKLAVAASLLAVGLSGWTAWSTGALCGSCGKGCAPAADDAPDLAARLAALERRLDGTGAPAPVGVAKRAASDGAEADLASAPRPVAVEPAPVVGKPASAETIASLEKRLAELEEKAARLEGMPMGQTADDGPSMPVAFRMPKVYGSVEQAAKDLELTPSQKVDFERAAADAQREMADLKKLPDADGETWESVEKGLLSTNAEGAMKMDLGKILGFPSRKIPGRTETFGEAQAKISSAAKRRMRDSLTADQQKKFDAAHTEPLTGGGGSGTFLSFSVGAPVVVEETK